MLGALKNRIIRKLCEEVAGVVYHFVREQVRQVVSQEDTDGFGELLLADRLEEAVKRALP